MNTKLSPDVMSDVNKKLVWALRDSDAENVCLECAQKRNKSIILSSHNKSPWGMSDTGLCLYCGSIKDVFCEAVIKVQSDSGLDPRDFLGNFPRIIGGSAALESHGFFANKSHAGYALRDEKSELAATKPSKRWWLYGIAGIIIVFSIVGYESAEHYRNYVIKGMEEIEPARSRVNTLMLKDFESIQSAGTVLPVDKVLKKETLETNFQNEKQAMDKIRIALEPINYYQHPEDAILAFGEFNGIVGDKMRMLNVLMQYKNAYIQNTATKGEK